MSTAASALQSARRWRIGGRVQGVGFRPFVYRLAHHHDLTGWVRNHGGEVEIHAEGPTERLQAFGRDLLARAPPAASACLLEVRAAHGEPNGDFRILPSARGTGLHVHVPADLFTCEECLTELRDPAARRYRYPFINCTQCGPRYTLIRSLPYDRANTTLDAYTLCRACHAEYADPLDRRFHAEPLACAACGPGLHWRDDQSAIGGNGASLAAALACLRLGKIVAVRGVGGYHLLCDAASEAAVARLRLRKRRPAKPLAVMLPWTGRDGLDYARLVAQLSPLAAAALQSPVRPIVLTTRNTAGPLAAGVAPGLREVALMLPYSPLHHLLLEEFGAGLVATSGNLSGEPVLTDPGEAHRRLAEIADGFLDHDRPIARPADDPVMRVVAHRARPMRLGRGNAPLEIRLPRRTRTPLLAVGAYQKTTIALAWGDRAVISPHIGELASPRARQVFAQVVRDLQGLYGVRAECIVHDAHPGFPNTRWARESGLPTQAVWHHYAHAAALAGEFPDDAPLLCFTWDGVGIGPDRSLWGGEAILGRPGAWKRVASLRPFRLPGGESAARQPWRTALGLCWECGRDWRAGAALGNPRLREAWKAGMNAPPTTSVGRLFDAAAALLGVCMEASYEGHAPMLLESLCNDASAAAGAGCIPLPLARDSAGIWRTDWAPLLPMLLDGQLAAADRAALFHASLAHALCEQALAVREETSVARVGFCGGVFQNRFLTEQAQDLLLAEGFEVLIPQQIPPNDAAISFGQLVEAIAIQETTA